MNASTSRMKLIFLLLNLLWLSSCSIINSTSSNPASTAQDLVAFKTDNEFQVDTTYIARINRADKARVKKFTPGIICDSISPDSKNFACTGSGIIITDLNGANRSRLTDTGYNPLWSSDGKWILFESLVEKADGSTINAVNAVNVDSKDKVTCPELKDKFTFSVEWIPGSYKILYIVGDGLQSNKLYECEVLNNTGKFIDIQAETSLSSVLISPDGKKIVYSTVSKNKGESHIFKIADFTSGGIINAKQFITEGSGGVDTKLPSVDSTLSWSPDGNEIAVAMSYSSTDNQQDVYIYDKNAALVKQLTNTPRWNELRPAWSASGRYILVTRSDGYGNPTINQMVALDVNNGKEVILASEPGIMFYQFK